MNREQLIYYLSGGGDDELFARAAAVKRDGVGTKVHLRGLIELSNICACDCLYCGIRRSNDRVTRYELTDQQVIESARYAFENHYGAIVIQSGELQGEAFIRRIERLVRRIGELFDGGLAITLSCGQQSETTYRRWLEAGAVRYLLRIESSSREIFERIHPAGVSFQSRVECIESLQRVGFITGSGVMIGLPGQGVSDLADDLLWLQRIGVDMCGMGPYIEHVDTPLAREAASFSRGQRVELTLRMVALLRVMMPHINIAATTALSTLDRGARGRAIEVGGNVLMPNVTPEGGRVLYSLYDNKATDLDLGLFGRFPPAGG